MAKKAKKTGDSRSQRSGTTNDPGLAGATSVVARRRMVQSVPSVAQLSLLTIGLAVLTGALQSSWRAGMAIPGWPGSFGNFWIFCPLDLWFGHADVFIAQSHRLVGQLAVVGAVCLTGAFWRADNRKSLKNKGLCLALLLLATAVSGGLRIAWRSDAWAAAHAIAAGLCLTLGAVLVSTILSGHAREQSTSTVPDRRLHTSRIRLPLSFLLVVLFLQLVAGSQLRHVDAAGENLLVFPFWVWMHILTLIVLAPGAVILALFAASSLQVDSAFRRMSYMLATLIGLQMLLGSLVWILQYGFPLWFLDYILTPVFTPRQGSATQWILNWLHVTIGYTILALGGVVLTKVPRKPTSSSA